MSYSQLIVFRNNEAEGDEKYRNGHGTAAMIWEALHRKYYRLIHPNHPFMAPEVAGINGGWEALWKADQGGLAMRPWERLALKFTYDDALVKGSDVAALADALDRFEDAHAVPGRVCHLSAIAKRLRELGPVDAVGLYATSVGEYPWNVRWEPTDEDDDPDYRPYDLTRDTKHWFIEVPS